jgi:acetyl esterase
VAASIDNGAPGATGAIVGRIYLERGRPVVVLARWAGAGPRNVLVQRRDGTKVVRPFRGLRRPLT